MALKTQKSRRPSLYLARYQAFIHLLTLVSLIATVACTKKNEVSNLSLSLPDSLRNIEANEKIKNAQTSSQSVSAASGNKVTERVMINITAPDLVSPAILIWDANDASSGSGSTTAVPVVPASFQLTVNRGTDRLVQVMILQRDFDPATGETFGPMEFRYGDIVASIQGDNPNLNVALTSTFGSSGIEGTIAGRWLETPSIGPTGPVEMMIQPPQPGRPPMIVARNMMFGGYFDFFTLADVGVSYRLATTGQMLFQNVNTEAFDSILSQRVMKVIVPQGYRTQSGSNTRQLQSEQRKIIGFFGPAASANQKVCFPSAGNVDGLYAAPSGSSVVSYNPVSNDPFEARIIGGGLSAGCSTSESDYGVTELILKRTELAYREGAIEVNGPFREFNFGGNGFGSLKLDSPLAGTYRLTWKYLNRVVGLGVDGVDLFTRTLASGESNPAQDWHETAPCNALTSLGFTQIGRVGAGSGVTPIQSFVLPGGFHNQQEYDNGRQIYVACPYSNTLGRFNFAISSYSSGPGSTSVPLGPVATQLQAAIPGVNPNGSSSGTRANVAKGVCTPIAARLVTATGLLGRYGGTLSGDGAPYIKVSVIGANASTPDIIHMQPNCIDTGLSSQSVRVDQFEKPSAVIYVKHSEVSPGKNADLKVELTDSVGSQLSVEYSKLIYVNLNQTTPTSATVLAAILPTQAHRLQCYPFGLVGLGNYDGGISVLDFPSTSSASLPTSFISYYSDPGCDSPVSSTVSLDSLNNATFSGYVKFQGIPLSGASFPITPAVVTYTNQTLDILAVGAPTRLRIEAAKPISTSECSVFRAALTDSDGLWTQDNGSDINLTFSLEGGGTLGTDVQVWDSPSCTGTTASIDVVSAGASRGNPLWWRVPTQGLSGVKLRVTDDAGTLQSGVIEVPNLP